MLNKTNIFSHKVGSILICLLTCALWGSLYPIIKVGYNCFHISSNDIPSLILFAGLRFTVSGLFLICISGIKTKTKTKAKLSKNDMKYIILGALIPIVLHYGFTYIGLSLGEGSKSAIIKQVGFLFLSCFAFIFDKEDTFSFRKLVAGMIGFLGIIVTNTDQSGFSLTLGDVLLILSSFCGVLGSVIAKKAVKTIPVDLYVAYPQFLGGVVMCAAGFFMGGRITHIDIGAVLVFCYICAASICAYMLWNTLLKYNNLSKLAVIKFAEPLFAVMFSGLLLNENIFRLSYLVALILIFVAIIIENTKILSKKDLTEKG